jgi:SAM-dependent methyltransferase
MLAASIPMPPLELRQMVGPTDPEAYDNPSGEPIYAGLGLSLDAYESVFDFGCGCGRVARQLLQQNPRPRRYVGIDVHRGMINWCKRHLSPLDPNFQFFHHDVYAPGYAPGNCLQLAQPFPVQDGEFSLVVAHSIFTHLFRRQTEYYLREVARILKPQGVAFTTWFFFDRDSFPFLLHGPFCLFVEETDLTKAVIYDRRWFIDTVRDLGLGVRSTRLPVVAGHQWRVLVVRRNLDTVDQFPLGEEAAEWLCGATLKPIANPSAQAEAIQKWKVASSDSQVEPRWPQPPPLFGALEELEATRKQLEDMKRSWMLGIGQTIVAFPKMLKRLLES